MAAIGGDGVGKTLLKYISHQKMGMKVDNWSPIHHLLLVRYGRAKVR
jgi:hypothetical protein